MGGGVRRSPSVYQGATGCGTPVAARPQDRIPDVILDNLLADRKAEPMLVALPDPAAARRLKLLWVSCGDKDGLLDVSQRTHADCQAKGVPHVWHVGPGRHDFAVWKADLYHFARKLFR